MCVGSRQAGRQAGQVVWITGLTGRLRPWLLNCCLLTCTIRRTLLASLLGSTENLMSPTYRRLLSGRPSGEADLRAGGSSGSSGGEVAAHDGSAGAWGSGSV